MPYLSSLPSRAQLRLVAIGYAAVFAAAAVLLYGRHLQELRYPAEASGGMWAAGDAMLYMFIAGLFLVPTAAFIWVLAQSESVYPVFSQILLGLSFSAPICLGMLWLGAGQAAQSFDNLCLLRLLASPFILTGIGISRFVARFDREKKLLSYAFLIEGLTLGIALVLLFHTARSNSH